MTPELAALIQTLETRVGMPGEIARRAALAESTLARLDPDGKQYAFPAYPQKEFEHPCPSCKGTGKRNIRPDPTCWTCGGSGRSASSGTSCVEGESAGKRPVP